MANGQARHEERSRRTGQERRDVYYIRGYIFFFMVAAKDDVLTSSAAGNAVLL